MTVERKNSLTFDSLDDVEVSVIYHTFIETCKMCGVSTLELRISSKQSYKKKTIMKTCCQ